MVTRDFLNRHALIAKTIDVDDNRFVPVLEKIGAAYFSFRQSNQAVFKLILPVTSTELVQLSIKYLQHLVLLLDIEETEPLTEFKNTFLFDIFKESSNDYLENFQIPYSHSKGNIVKWGNSTITAKFFLPVFRDGQLNSTTQIDGIKRAFNLFRKIRNSKKLNHTVTIDLSQRHLLLTNKSNHIGCDNMIGFLPIEYKTNQDSSETKTQYKLIKEAPITTQFIIRHPYYSNIDHRLIGKDIGKTFEAEFRTRLFVPDLKDIDPSEVYILPRELVQDEYQVIVSPYICIEVVTTNHNIELRDLLIELRKGWRNQNFNPYTHPFPKYFFLFINSHLTVDYWIELFDKLFPLIRSTSLFNSAVKVISLLHKLDWLSHYVQGNDEPINFIFPDTQNNTHRSKRLHKAFSSQKNIVNTVRPTITFDERIIPGKRNYVLNGFDIVDASNNLQNHSTDTIKFIFPDFLYYNYAPFVVLHIFDYQANTYFTDARRILLEEFDSKRDEIATVRSGLKDKLLSDLKTYQKQFKHETNEIEKVHSEDLIPDPDEITEAEESISQPQMTIGKQYDVECFCSNGKTIRLPSNKIVFVKRRHYTRTTAANIRISDQLLNLDGQQITELLKHEQNLDKLSDIPESVKSFQSLLSQQTNAYQRLERLGLDYVNDDYFTANYLKDPSGFNENTFKIPRKRKNWTIIGSYLGYEPAEINLAYIAWYGRQKRNELKRIYKRTIEYIAETDFFEKTENRESRQQLIDIILPMILSMRLDEEENVEDIANSIIDNVMSELDNLITEVKTVNHLR